MKRDKIKLFYGISFSGILVGKLHWLCVMFFTSTLLMITGCTSVGHEAHTKPQIDYPLSEHPDVVAVVGWVSYQ